MTTSDDNAERNHALWSHYQRDPSLFAGAAPRLDAVAKELLRRLPAGGHVLTIGVGDGYLERRLRAAGVTVSALDLDAASIEALRGDGFDAHVAKAEAMPFGGESFDAVAASEVLEHLTDDQGDAALREIRRVLRPHGWLVGTVPYRENLAEQEAVCPHCGEVFHRWGHARSFDEAALRADLGRYFSVVELGHRSFVSFRGRSAKRLLTGAAHWVLGRLGSRIAFPNILFAVQRS